MIERLLAFRYLFSKQGISLVSTLTMISIGGVTIGTALLIVVLSVFNGFHSLIQGLLLSSDPDIRIEHVDTPRFDYSTQMIRSLEEQNEVVHVNPYLSGKSILTSSRGTQTVVEVKGILPERYFPNIEQSDFITEGFFDVSTSGKQNGLLMNRQLVSESGQYLNDNLYLMSAEGIVKGLTQFSGPRNLRFSVNGIYNTTHLNNTPQALIHLKAAQNLFYSRGEISGIDLRLTSHEVAEEVASNLRKTLGSSFSIQTWYDLQKPLYDVMKIEKWASYFILMIIVLVAVFNIVGSLTMIVIQKSRDIGLLMAIGLTEEQIQRTFLIQGMFIGLIGCGLGGVLGLGLSWLQKTYGIVKLAGSGAFIIDAYPVLIQPLDVIVVLAGSLVLCLLASRRPSKRAVSINPAVALKYE